MSVEMSLASRPETVSVLAWRARVGAERRLRSQQTDADEAGGELHRPHVRLAEDAQVDRRVRLAQLMASEGQECEYTDHDERPHPPGTGPVEPQEREPGGDQQQRETEQDEPAEVEGASGHGLRFRDAEEDGEEDEGHRHGRKHHGQRDVAAESREDAAAGERPDDRSGFECDDEQAGRSSRL